MGRQSITPDSEFIKHTGKLFKWIMVGSIAFLVVFLLYSEYQDQQLNRAAERKVQAEKADLLAEMTKEAENIGKIVKEMDKLGRKEEQKMSNNQERTYASELAYRLYQKEDLDQLKLLQEYVNGLIENLEAKQTTQNTGKKNENKTILLGNEALLGES
jgi:uncharacterized protein Smg (DUF494 family)